MQILDLPGSDDTPKIIFDKTNQIFEISGRSLPEDSAAFYKPVLEWIRGYAKEPLSKTDFIFKLEYFNTSSSKLILDVLSDLEPIQGMNIHWYYHEDDEDMEDAGKEFSELVEIPFEFSTY